MDKDIRRQPHAYLQYGLSGHEDEYVFTMQATSMSEPHEIDFNLEYDLEDHLGEGWSVMNRGERLEIVPPNRSRDTATDKRLLNTLKRLIPRKYIFTETRIH